MELEKSSFDFENRTETSTVVTQLPRRVRRSAVVEEYPDIDIPIQAQREIEIEPEPKLESEAEQEPQEEASTVVANITNELHKSDPSNHQHLHTCSIFVVPPDMRVWDEEAYRPKVVVIGPTQGRGANFYKYWRDYEDMEDCKRRILHSFVSKREDLNEPDRTSRLINQCLLKMKKHEAKIRSYYSYEIEPQSDKLANIMMRDGCFLLHLLLEREKPLVAGRVWIWTLVRYDLLQLDNQIPFFVICKLHKILGIGKEKEVDLVEQALKLFRDAYPLSLRENITVMKRSSDQVFHLLHIFYSSLLPDSSKHLKSSASAPIWIPCASELTLYGVEFRKKTSATSFLDISFTRRGVMEIPPILIGDHTKNLLRNLIAFEQCYPYTQCHITVYCIFMECIINNDKDVRLLSLNNVVTNRMSADQSLTLFFSSLCKGIHFARDRFYLANVFANVTDYQNNKWKKCWADFKRNYCSNIWVVIAVLVSAVIFVATIVQAVYGALSYYNA